jgi:aryl-alcohol dehydrogenase-like predicted oxidoreductase
MEAVSPSRVGLGAGRIGGPELDDRDVDRLVGAALDLGVTVIDTARSYGASEERLGRALAGGRRGRIVLSTKVGYGVPGVPDWTGPCVAQGVDAALRRLGTDRLDVVYLHSCPLEVLARGDVVEALARAVDAGKVGAAGYSGENEELAWASASGRFAAVQCSVSVVDRPDLSLARGLAVYAKRPLGNAPWRHAERPAEPDVAEAWDRFRALALEPDLPWDELFARFAAWTPGVTSILVGTASAAHLAAAVAAVARGPLPAPRLEAVRARQAEVGAAWRGRI